jgi:lysozyme
VPRSDFLDLSHWDVDPLDWDLMQVDGVKAIIFKVTESTGYVDPTYKVRKKEARDAGLKTGGYHFMRPGNMKAQVDWFLKNADFDGEDRACIDHEDEEVSLDDLKEFAAELERRVGRRVTLYSGHLIKEQVGTTLCSELKDTDLWLAQYGDKPSWPVATWPKLWAWQFTDGTAGPQPHSVAGVPGDSAGNLDINEFYGNWDSWSGADKVVAQPGWDPSARGPRKTLVITISVPSGTTLEDVQVSIDEEE